MKRSLPYMSWLIKQLNEYNKENPKGAVKYKDIGSGSEHPELKFTGDWNKDLEKYYCVFNLFFSSGQLVVAMVRNMVFGWIDFGLT